MRVINTLGLKILLFIHACIFIYLWLSFPLKCSNDASFTGRKLSSHATTIYVITATYKRPEQMAELTRLGQTLALDGHIHWIVVEDANSTSTHIDRLLLRFGNYFKGLTHLYAWTPNNEQLSQAEPRWRKVRGVHQRNAGLRWLRDNFQSQTVPHGIVYFADDDNSYDIRLFDKMRNIKKVGVWPVGLVAKLIYEGPICDNSQSQVLMWRTSFRPDRFCACDMAGFAVSLPLILQNESVEFSVHPGIGMLEADFLSRLVFAKIQRPKVRSEILKYLEPIVCDEILVWHTRTKETDLSAEQKIGTKFPALLYV